MRRDTMRGVSLRPAPQPRVYGLMAEFPSPEALLHAIETVRSEGYTRLDAFTPYPIEEVSEALGHHHSKLSRIVFAGGLTGALTGLALQYWVSAIAYPLNVGGRPYFSWPAFIIVMFELTILFASLSAVLGMLALNGLPMPYHPVFNVERFALASRDRYFLCIEARDKQFDQGTTRSLLERLAPTEVNLVLD